MSVRKTSGSFIYKKDPATGKWITSISSSYAEQAVVMTTLNTSSLSTAEDVQEETIASIPLHQKVVTPRSLEHASIKEKHLHQLMSTPTPAQTPRNIGDHSSEETIITTPVSSRSKSGSFSSTASSPSHSKAVTPRSLEHATVKEKYLLHVMDSPTPAHTPRNDKIRSHSLTPRSLEHATVKDKHFLITSPTPTQTPRNVNRQEAEEEIKIDVVEDFGPSVTSIHQVEDTTTAPQGQEETQQSSPTLNNETKVEVKRQGSVLVASGSKTLQRSSAQNATFTNLKSYSQTQRPNFYQQKDSNIENIGSTMDIQQRVSAAKNETEWKDAGTKVGLQVWRIENFAVKAWSQVGTFFNGDSFIVLNTYMNRNKLAWDVHFWLGSQSSLDEIGTAAYKAVELDDFLGGFPVQHREIEGHESTLFLSYFPKFTVLNGGIDSGFQPAKPESYRTRLLQIKGKHVIHVTELPCAASSLNNGDSFVVDAGLQLFVWEGSKSRRLERYTANKVASDLRFDRGGKPTIFKISEGEETDEFWSTIGGQGEITKVDNADASDEHVDKTVRQKQVFLLSDASGAIEFRELTPQGGVDLLDRSILDSNDVFIVDVGFEIFVWIGSGSSETERKFSMKYAMDYIQQHNRPQFIPVTRVIDKVEPSSFWSHFIKTE